MSEGGRQHPGGVAVVAVDDNAVCDGAPVPYPWRRNSEIPAGKLSTVKTIMIVPSGNFRGNRLHGSGYRLSGAIYPSPGFQRILYIYLATGLTRGAAHPDETNSERLKRCDDELC